MTKQIGQTYLNPKRTILVEIEGITKTGRVKFREYFSGGKASSITNTWSEKEFDKFYPYFVANA